MPTTDTVSQQDPDGETRSTVTLHLHSVPEKDTDRLFKVRRWYVHASKPGKVKSALIVPAAGWNGETEVDEASYTHFDDDSWSVGEAQTFIMTQTTQEGGKTIATLSNMSIIADDRSLDGVRIVQLMADVDVQLK